MAVPESVQVEGNSADSPPPKVNRSGILLLVAVAQLMVVLDTTVVNIALPSAQRDLGFGTDSRQWVVTGYALAFGSLLLLGGRLSDLLGRRVTLLVGLLGFAVVSAVGGAATSFGMLLAARALQGAFAAVLAPAALSTLNITFTEPKERARAFAVYTAVAGGGGAIGLIVGGALTEWLSWRWCLYVNLFFAIPAAIGVLAWVRRSETGRGTRIDLVGALLGSGGLFCLVYGLSNAEQHGWGDSLTIGMMIGAAVLLALFVLAEARITQPLLPLRVVADRNRAGSLLTIATGACSQFGTFLFLTYFLQVNLEYSPLKTGLAFLPLTVGLVIAAGLSNTLLAPRFGPRPLVPIGLVIGAGAMWWLTQLSIDSTYAADVVGPVFLLGFGLGTALAPSLSTATSGIRSEDAGVGSAMTNTSLQIGGAIGAASLSAVFTNSVTGYLSDHHPSAGQPAAVLQGAAAIHGYTAAFGVAAVILLVGAVVLGLLFRSGPVETTEGVPVAV